MTDTIELSGLRMKHFTELDAELYCLLSNINPEDIEILYLENNRLEDISGISIFKNLKVLILNDIDITDLNSLNGLNYLYRLHIRNLDLIDELNTVRILKNLPNLKVLFCENTFKKVKIKKELKGISVYDGYN